MPVTAGATSTEANLNDTSPAAPANAINVKWQAGSPTIDPNDPNFQVRDISAYVPLDPDGTLAANSDSKVASQKATKTYVDALASATTTSLAGKVPTSRLINTTAPLTGGGDLSADRTLDISNFTGDSGSGGAKGTVPAPAAGDAAAGKFLKADGTWTAPSAGSGTVTHTGGALGAHQVVIGNGGADVETPVAVGAAGTYFRSSGAGADPAFAAIAESEVTNLVSDLALKAPLASPAFTGTPTAPTPSTSDNSTKLATTAFVQAFAPGGGGSLALDTNGTPNGSQALLNLLNGAGITITDNGSGGVTIARAGFSLGGDGSDGALTFDGTSTVLGMAPATAVYTLTRDIMATNLTVNANDGSGHTVEIKTNGFAIFCTGTLTVSGHIDNDGAVGNAGGNAASSTGANGGGSVTLVQPSTSTRYPRITAGASTAGTAGGNGGTTTGTQAGAANVGAATTNAIDSNGASGSSGSAGGKGGTGTSGAGGSSRSGGAGGTTPSAAPPGGRNVFAAQNGVFLTVGSLTTSIYGASNSGHGGAAGGSGGGGDGTNAGGGGGGGGSEGGSGGMVGIFAAIIVVNSGGIISSNGGTGGKGGDGRTQAVGNVGGGGGGAGGAGGRGGIIWLIYNKLTNSGTIQAAGGTHGVGGAKGSPHGTGTDDAAAGVNGPDGPAGVVIQIAC